MKIKTFNGDVLEETTIIEIITETFTLIIINDGEKGLYLSTTHAPQGKDTSVILPKASNSFILTTEGSLLSGNQK